MDNLQIELKRDMVKIMEMMVKLIQNLEENIPKGDDMTQGTLKVKRVFMLNNPPLTRIL